MGDTLIATATSAFGAEFEKTAIQFPRLREFARRAGSPTEGFRRGWEALSPVGLMQQGGQAGKDLSEAVGRTQAARKALDTKETVKVLDSAGQARKGWFGQDMEYSGKGVGQIRAHLANTFRAGTHLDPNAELSKGVQGMAERASRSGWTGEGRATKYLPVGQKGMLTAGTLASMPGIVDAVKYGPSEQFGGAAEQAGSLAGFTLPAIMFGGMPTASFVAPIMAGMAGGRLGRAIDRTFDPRVKAMQKATE